MPPTVESRWRLRLRMSNQSSTAIRGRAARSGIQNGPDAVTAAATSSATSTAISTAAMADPPLRSRSIACGKLFGTVCTPENPVGSCMVSSEGACAAHYSYGRYKDMTV